MNSLFNLAARIVRSLIKLLLVMIAFAVIFFILAVGLAVAVLSIVWSLLRGRKPAGVAVFQRFHKTSQQFRTRGTPSENSADIVDIQAHEVRTYLSEADSSNKPDTDSKSNQK